ncbi:phosphatase PAP2 family protein [Streptomyces piniterrae]|uniref:Phosphatase PAP2 family protein n=1 Tax=Streptomyces piniterrae TaxID=2571125 RepID=A0A4U0MZF1_9ACTN|nr:phosphatase PAP2 family protein [Streptomyces piniterrae]TJZ46306.1 phosphatase PAP2 family protein [Streptomyces piniterrae]
MLFAVLTWQVAWHGPLRTLDERLGRTVAAGAIPARAAELFADLGNTVVALPVLLTAAAWAAWRGWRTGRRADVNDPAAAVRWWLPPLAAAPALAAVPALVVPLKLWLARPGPPQMRGGTHDGFYPSGHAATAAVAYGAAALLLTHSQWHSGRRRSSRPRSGRRAAARVPAPLVLTTGAVLLNIAVGIGLVRQGYHWPLDVLGSWCLAGVVLSVWWAVCARWAAGPVSGSGRRPPKAWLSCRSPAPSCPSPSTTDCAARHACRRGSSTTG